MSDWIDTTLGEFIGLQRGHDLPKKDRRAGKVPVIGSGGLAGWHDEAIVTSSGVTLGRAANLGVPQYIDGPFWPLNTTLYITDFHGNDPRFAYYLLRALDLAGYNSGSVQPMLNRNYIKNVRLRVPLHGEQVTISSQLGALDDKIAVNEQIATTCDELRSLVVSEALVSKREQFGEAPLSSLASFVNGRAFTKGATGSGRMVIRIAELNSGPGTSTIYSDMDVSDQHVARPGDVLFAWSGSLRVSRWFRPEAIVNQHIFKVIPSSGVPNWLIYELINLRMPEFRSIAADKATTMGHIQRRHLDDPVLVPNESMLSELHRQLEPLWRRALVAEQESLALAALRDALLPKLMSGEIRVKDAERQVGEVV
jgi:type I restriction enzyme S subunit